MNQDVLDEQFALYLESQNNFSLAKRVRDNGGHCYGYSLCYSIMALTGKLAWWVDAINKAGAWNGDVRSLKSPTYLNQAINPHETLDFLFQRLINYVVFHQGEASAREIFKGINQKDMLKPEKPYFENQGNKTRYCKNMMGYFTEEDLDLIITSSSLENKIVLIGSLDHCCAIRYADNQWHFFNPNHSCSEARVYKSKSEFLKSIIEDLDNTFDICFASLELRGRINFNNYYKLLEQKPQQLLRNKAFNYFVSNGEDHLYLIFKHARKNEQVRKEILSSLAEKHTNKKTGLYNLITWHPEYLKKLINVFSQSPTEFDRFLISLPISIDVNETSKSRPVILIKLLVDLKRAQYNKFSSRGKLATLLDIRKELAGSTEYSGLQRIIEAKISKVANSLLPSPLKKESNAMEVEYDDMNTEPTALCILL